MGHYKKHTKNTIYTRNLDPLCTGHFFSNINMYDQKEEEIDLHNVKKAKICISIPTFKNSFFLNEIAKVDTLLNAFADLECFVISNEPTYTQYRLTKGQKYQKLQVLSDFKNREFARSTGTYIYELSSLVKAVFIMNRNDKLVYVKYYDDLYSNIDLEELAQEAKKAAEM